MTIEDRKLEITIGLFLLGGIVAWLIIPISFQDTTIILEGGGGGAPVSCLPSGGFVLAQNLTDLCDVTIVSPSTNQIIEYNGSQWVNVNHATFNDTTTCNNIGIGNAFICVEGTNVNLRSFLAGTGITVSNDTNTITVTNSLPEATTCSNVGTGNFMLKTTTQNCVANSLIAGTGITISNTTDDYTFASQCANTGTGEAICESANNINSLIAGNSISITDTTGDLTITNTGVIKLCETVAAGGETSLTCTLNDTTQAFHFFIFINGTTTNDIYSPRFNSDSGNNYAYRTSNNGGADATTANTDSMPRVTITANQQVQYDFMCQDPTSNKEKYCYGFRMFSTNGAGNVPTRLEIAAKYAVTNSQITSINIVRTTGTGTLNSGSYIIAYGVS